MYQDQDLSKLESVIENLLQKYQELQQEKKELELMVLTKDDTITDLHEQIDALQTDKTQISSKVSNILNSIAEWEKKVETGSAESQDGVVEEAALDADSEVSEKSELFSIGE